ncbi:putative ascorbate peroxidase [Watersipora subatra]|uniref:putative ascorbate peroxidase n=1 Tax=Watersipora subatra TaxID=2589382 RepID=UPI00355C8217
MNCSLQLDMFLVVKDVLPVDSDMSSQNHRTIVCATMAVKTRTQPLLAESVADIVLDSQVFAQMHKDRDGRKRPGKHGEHGQPGQPGRPGLPGSGSVDSLRGSIRSFISKNVNSRLPLALRLVFHSCVGSTGCDGCINTADKANTGLQTIYKDTINLWKSLGKPISFADFVVLLGTVAVELGMSRKGGPGHRRLPFKTGRSACKDPSNYRLSHKYHQGQDPNSLAFLMKEFKLSRNQAVALMGAHSLGTCKASVSGFVGPWDRTTTTLDNGFYLNLANTNFDIKKAPNGFTQWSKNGQMMLHADMSLARNLKISSGQTPLCKTSNQCSASPDRNQVVKYAKDQKTWANDFQTAFLKMVEH